jgi:peptidoglycan hydrolase-like protein with peptidoglycan-binding domain
MSRPNVKRGDRNDAVKELQERLNIHGFNCGRPDGVFGKGTERAAKDFARRNGLSWSGEIGGPMWAKLDEDPPKTGMEPDTLLAGGSRLAQTWNKYGKVLREQAVEMGFSPAAVLAVLLVEAGGMAFGYKGALLARFENHVFWDYWGKKGNEDRFKEHFRYSSSKRWTGHEVKFADSDVWEKCHTSQKHEWKVMALAASMDPEATYDSASFGLPQMMGFNAETCGYANAVAMVNAWSESAAEQIDGMFEFIEANRKMHNALKAGDYVTFARYYNGPGKAEDYGAKIADAVARAKAAGVS